MKKQLIWGPESPLRMGEGGREGVGIQLCLLSEKQGHVFAMITHLPQKLLQGNKREREAQSKPRHSGVSGDAPESAHNGQTRHCCCWQPEICHTLPALYHEMPFPSRWEKISPQQMEISLRQGTGGKPLGQTRGRVKLHTQKRSHGSLSCAP